MKLLTEPLQIRNVRLRNRLVLPPMAINAAGASGKEAEHNAAYYAGKSADRSLGLIIQEHAFVSADGMLSKGQLSIADPEDAENLRVIVQAVHENGTPIFAQISHAGAMADVSQAGVLPLSPSLRTDWPVRTATREDIARIVEDFTHAALRAKEAGYDGVEIHSAHGYLLDEFYSPLTNHRTDEYGGSLENRVRIHREIIRSIRKAAGEDYPISLRLGALDYAWRA